MAISLYKIKLNINPKEDSYRGTVKIYSSTKEIVLDCEVEVKDVYYLNKSIPFSLEKNKLTIKLEPSNNTESESESKNESEEVRIDFIGKIRDSLLGLYRSNDTLVTHFEPNDARKLFPCQDTPKIKSIFQMEVSVPKEYIVLFNTSVLTKKEYDDKTEYSFKVTPLMSTYLLALSVGKYDALEIIDNKFKIIKYEELLRENFTNSDSLSNNEILSDLSEENLISFSKSLENNKTKLRIYTERNLAHTAKLSLFLTDQLIKNLSSLFNYNFMLDKLDQLSLKKFGMGAMENFGLITYRESLLLFDKKSSVFFMAYIAETVAHELVHQWFGNLVTPSSWEDLWLNEGFATFLSNYVLDEYEYFIPKEVLQSFNEENDKLSESESDEIKTEKLNYNFMADFISHSETGLFLDSLSSHPIISSSNANELFDEITYQKASSVIKMLFTDKIPLLKSYINKFAYKSVKSKHILTHLNLQMIYDWLYKKHYPLLKIKLEKTNLVIEQEVFTLLPTKEETTWFVPIEILIKDERKIFEMKEKKLVLDLKNEFMNFCENQINFIKINNGFFRVWYQDPLFYSELDIFKVNDLYSLLLRGDILLKDYLEIIKKNDFEEYHLFESVTSQLMSLMKKIGLSDEYLLRILNKEIEPKKEGLNLIMAMKRESLRLKLLTLLGKQPVIPEKPHFRTPKFIKMSKEGKESDLFTLYKSTKIPDERSASIFSLFTTNNLEKLKEYFNKLINKEISLSDSIYIFNGLANNLKLRLEIFDLILQTDLEKLFGDDKNLLGDCLESLFSNVPDEYVDKVSKYVMVDGIEFKRNVILEMMEVDRNVRKRVSKN